jgi:hypothetical protein
LELAYDETAKTFTVLGARGSAHPDGADNYNHICADAILAVRNLYDENRGRR